MMIHTEPAASTPPPPPVLFAVPDGPIEVDLLRLADTVKRHLEQAHALLGRRPSQATVRLRSPIEPPGIHHVLIHFTDPAGEDRAEVRLRLRGEAIPQLGGRLESLARAFEAHGIGVRRLVVESIDGLLTMFVHERLESLDQTTRQVKGLRDRGLVVDDGVSLKHLLGPETPAAR